MGDSFFLGFADEITKLAQAAKAYKDKTGQWKFRPVATPMPGWQASKPVKKPTATPTATPKVTSPSVGGASRSAQQVRKHIP